MLQPATAQWPLGELEVAVFLPNEDGELRPLTSKLRRSLMRYGLQRERLQRLRIGNTRVRRLVEGIANGDLRVLASKEQASWGKQDADDNRTNRPPPCSPVLPRGFLGPSLRN